MAYQTGVSGSVNDLMTALLAFASSNGFTLGATWSFESLSYVSLVKDGIHFIFAYDSTVLYINTATATSGSGALTTQTGAAAVSMQINQIAGPHISYHFFCDGTACHAAVEIATEVFSHFNFGFVTKNGTWTGGAFVTGTTIGATGAARGLLSARNFFPFYTVDIGGATVLPTLSRPHIRSDVANVNGISPFGTGATFPGSSSTVFNKAWLSAGGGRPLMLANPNVFNGRSVIVPVTLLQSSTLEAAPYFQIGHVPNAGVINIANIQPKTTVNTDWMVFPIGQKGSSGTAYIHSLNYAMAYKK